MHLGPNKCKNLKLYVRIVFCLGHENLKQQMKLVWSYLVMLVGTGYDFGVSLKF